MRGMKSKHDICTTIDQFNSFITDLTPIVYHNVVVVNFYIVKNYCFESLGGKGRQNVHKYTS
jgi:hypothetical protein